MIYTKEVENMCPVAKGAKHEPAPIPEEGKWVHSKKIEDISGFTHGVGWCAPQQGACKLSLNVKNGVIEEALVETIGCSGMTHSAAMAAEILQGKTILEALNTDLVCDAINTAMRELFLQIVYGRTQSAFSDDGLAVGAGLEDLGKGLRSQVGTMYATKEKGVRYLEMAEGYVTGIALDADNEVIGYQFVSLGKMTDFIKKGDYPNTAWEKANKVRKKPLRVILNGLGKDAAQIISRINGFTFVETKYDYKTATLNTVYEKAYSDGLRATVKCYGADDVQEGVAIMHKENVGVSITGNSTNPTRFQHPVAGTYKKECIEQGKKYFSVASGGGTGRTLHPDNMAAGPASYGMTDTLGRMHSDAQFAGSSSVPAHVEMMGLIGMGNNPMVGATVAVAVSVEEAATAGKF